MYKFILIYFVLPVMLLAQSSSTRDTADFRLDEVNIYGSRILTDKFNSVNSVQILTRKIIKNLNGNSLGDILAYQGELYIKSYGGNGSLKTISADGLGAENTAVMLNGVRLNSAQNSQYDLSLISTDNIERVEIVNDALSTDFGSGSTGGVINIITNGSCRKNSYTLKGSAGSYNFFRYFAGVNLNYGNSGLLINISKEKSDNDYEYNFNNGITNQLKHRANSGYQINNLFTSYNYSNKNYILDVYALYLQADRNLPGPETGNVSAYAIQKDEQLSLIYKLKKIVSEKLSFESSGGYRYSLQNYNDNINPEYYKEGNYFLNIQSNYAKGIYNLTSGVSVNYFKLISEAVTNDAKRLQPSVYSLMELNLGKVIIAPSARFEYSSDFGKGYIYGKAGINYKPFSAENLHFRFCIANGGRVPTFNELYWKTVGSINLKPEKSVSMQAGFIYSFNLFAVNTFEVSYTGVKVNDKILWKPVNGSIYWSPMNVSESKSDILTATYDVNKKISKNISAGWKFVYTYNRAVKTSNDYAGDPTQNKQLIYIPIEIAQSSLNLSVYNFVLNILYTFTGKRYINEDNSLFIKATDLFGANISCSQKFFNLDFNIKFEINNLTNIDYQEMPGYPAPLRNYKLELKINY